MKKWKEIKTTFAVYLLITLLMIGCWGFWIILALLQGETIL